MSAFFDQTHIQQILQTINLVDIVSSYVSLKSKGKEMVGLCPFHEDSRPSLNVNTSKQIFKCFACGAGGDVIKFMMLREKLSFPEAVVFLAEKAGIKLPERRREAGEGVDRNELEKLNRWAGRYYRGLYAGAGGERARKYVEGRGISKETADRFGLGWAPAEWDTLAGAARKESVNFDHLVKLGLLIQKEQGGYYDRFRERLIFPVIDAMGRVIGFGGRTLGDDPAKYLNSPESVLFDKSRALYGIHGAKDSIVKERRAIVVEGYTDCIMAHQYGLTNVVATLGTALTTEHAQALSRYGDEIVLMFDADRAGVKAADRAIEIFFGQQIEVKLVSLPKGMDPCDYLLEYGRDSLADLVGQATEALEYKWQTTLRRLEGDDSVNGRRRAVEEFLNLTAQAFNRGGLDAISRGFVLNKVAKLVGQPADEVYKRLGQLERRLGARATAGTSQPFKPRAAMTDSYTSSVRQMLEVLLNRSDLFERVKGALPEDWKTEDPILRPIAERIWEYSAQGGRGGCVEIIAMVESTELCKIMTDMALEGEQRGNFEQSLADALSNIKLLLADRERQTIREHIATSSEKYGAAAQTAMLKDIQSKLREDKRRYPMVR